MRSKPKRTSLTGAQPSARFAHLLQGQALHITRPPSSFSVVGKSKLRPFVVAALLPSSVLFVLVSVACQRETERAAEERLQDESEWVSRVRVKAPKEDQWTSWSRVPGRLNLWVRARITSYNNAAEKYMWWAQFENRYSNEVCHTFGVGLVGEAEGTDRHRLDPGERGASWFLVAAGPGGTAELVVDDFELQDGCF